MKVRNWDKWQSYRKDRGQPPWIKIHREVMRNPDWVSLSDAERGHLVAIWLLAADKNGSIPDCPRLIMKLCFLDSEPDLQMLIDKGFLERDANATPTRRQRDANATRQNREEAETEAEEDKKKTTRTSALDYSSWPSLPSDQVMKDWLAMRKRLKANVTQTVVNRLGKKLHAAVDAGFTVDDCIGEAIERNWKGFDVSWMKGDCGSGKDMQAPRYKEL